MTKILALLALGMAGWLLRPWNPPAMPVPPALAPVPVPPPPVMPPSRPEDSLAVVERPLFTAARRLPAGSVASSATPEAELVGVIAGGAAPLALLRVAGRVVKAAPGHEVAGWRVERIEARRVLLRRGDVSLGLALAKRPSADARLGSGGGRP